MILLCPLAGAGSKITYLMKIMTIS